MNIPKAEIITIGDEILYGQTLDTNAHWISELLGNAGVKIKWRTSVGDVETDIVTAIDQAFSRSDIILITGGLGPTRDDLTKPVLAKYFGSEIKLNEKAYAELKALMDARGRELNHLTSLQAHLPENCEMISNERGTAAGMWFKKDDKVLVAMPGVPHEMQHMMQYHVLSRLRETFSFSTILHEIIRVAGIGESWLAEKIQTWEDKLPKSIKLAYLPTYGDIKLRLTAIGEDKTVLKADIDRSVATLLPLLKGYAYGSGDETLEQVIGQLLRDHKQTIALAESCTGGYIAHRITSVAGSSDYFMGGIIPYQNDIKISMLGVEKATIEHFGAVSKETVTEMAMQVRKKFKATYGLATSGIAGPGGGTKEKPVGLVWVAIADESGVMPYKLQFTQERETNIRLTATNLLHLFFQRLTKND
jgi:nicotinamide-nucleotide amidase